MNVHNLAKARRRNKIMQVVSRLSDWSYKLHAWFIYGLFHITLPLFTV